jgi:hypothetical protein
LSFVGEGFVRNLGILTASIIAGTLGAAQAGTTQISLSGRCDSIAITLQSNTLAAAVETDPDGRCETFLAGGRIGRIKDLGRAADVSGVINGSASPIYTLDVQLPLVTGGAWQLYQTSDGVHLTPAGGGTYTVTGPVAGSHNGPTMKSGATR